MPDLKQKMKDCYNSELKKFTPTQEFRGPERRADCPNANDKACIGRHTDNQDLSYSADSQWRIVGQPAIRATSGPNANAGFVGPFVDPAGRTASAAAVCRGSGCGGPGAWAQGYVVGSIQRVASEDEKKQVMGTCFNKIFRSN
jgi:hypothetical protein